MAICQGCGSEIIGRDRFCRKCGAPVPTSVADLVDTRHLNPNAPPHATSTAGSHEFTAPFYAPPATYPQGGNVSPIYQTGSLKKKSGTWKIILLVGILMLSIFVATGIVISMQGRRNRQNISAEPPRRSFPNAVRNGLGMEIGNLSEQEFPGVSGVFIDSLTSDESPAAKASIQAGDVLMALKDQTVQNVRDLAQLLRPLTGTVVPAKILRDGKTLILPITVADPDFAPPLPEPRDRDQGLLGVDDVGSRRYILTAQKWGVTIQSPSSNGPADLAGLQRGDIITEFNGYPVRTHNEFLRRIHATKPRIKVLVKFYRDNTEQTAEVLMGHR